MVSFAGPVGSLFMSKLYQIKELAAPSSSDATSDAGLPIAMGSIVNIFRGGLVAVRIDDDLSSVAISLEVNIPEVVDPSQSVPEELKSNKSSSDALGTYLLCE